MTPLRLLHVVPTYLPAYSHGGPIHSVHGLCRALVARGHRVDVFTTDVHGAGRLDVPLGQPVDRDGVAVTYFPIAFPRRLYRSPKLRQALAAVLGEPDRRPDAVHLHSLFLLPTTVAARAAERSGVPYLVAPRGMLVPELIARRGSARKRLWLRLVERRTIERAAALHATTELEALDAGRFGLDLPPVRIVPNGIDLEPFEAKAEAERDDVRALLAEAATAPFVLFLGRLSWKKGLDRLIEAVAAIPATGEGPRLVIAGPDEEGTRDHLAAQAGALGLGDRVRFLGPVHGANKVALLRGARLLALPSAHENFANAVLEAMAAGTAVVVSPTVGLAPAIAASGAGLVAGGEPGEDLTSAFTRAIGRLVADPAAARAMGERGREAARDFAWPAVAAQMEAVYREITGRSDA